ncbi:MAG TPA: peptidylprolyl isomerase [Bryobacteraceae bacterium]|nr:peptidylprolyl isomerase [Bryobacteraceae bacterium]
MFDLFRSRDKAVRILLGAMLVLVGLSMLTYLIPNYGPSNSSGNDQVVAEIGKQVITTADVQKMVQSSQQQRQLPQEMLPTFVPQMVDDMITERALAYEAQRLGYQVTDADVREAIKQMAPALFPNGQFVGKEQYAAMLAQQGVSIPEFESDLRRQILITRLRNIAVEGTVVTPAEIEQEFRKKYEKIKVEWVELKPEMFNKESQPTEQEMRDYFKANQASYQTPEKRDLAVLIADQSKLEAGINPTDTQLQALYNQNKDQYHTPETVDVQQILLMTQGKPASEDASIKAKAEDVLKQAKAGGDFGQLAKKYSDDPGSKDKGGLYAGVTRGQMVPEFEQAAFSLKPGQISDLVKTQYGYHIVKVLKHDQPRLKPFEEVKAQLADQFKKQQAAQQMQQIADKAQTALMKDPDHPDKVAAEFNMQLVQAAGIEAGKPVPEIGANADFDQSIAGLKKGEVSAAVALPNNRIALAVVTNVIPARPSTYEEVQSQIHDLMVNNRSQAAMRKKANDLFTAAKAYGGDLEKAAKSLGLPAPKTSPEVERTGTVEGLGSAQYLTEAFGKPDGAIFGPSATPTGTLVGKVIAHVAPDMSKLAAERDAIRDQIKSQNARNRNTLFEAGLRDDLRKRGVIKVHQDVINTLIAQYRQS